PRSDDSSERNCAEPVMMRKGGPTEVKRLGIETASQSAAGAERLSRRDDRCTTNGARHSRHSLLGKSLVEGQIELEDVDRRLPQPPSAGEQGHGVLHLLYRNTASPRHPAGLQFGIPRADVRIEPRC